MKLSYFLLTVFSYTSSIIVESVLAIVGGKNANFGDAPYMVSIRVDDRHWCGGTLITDYWILTAAHCIYEDDVVYSILYGTLLSFNGAFSPIYSTREVVRKEVYQKFDFVEDIYIYDVGLVKVNEVIPFSPFIHNVKLPVQYAPIPTTGKCLLLGWGQLNSDYPDIPHILQKVWINVDINLKDQIKHSLLENEFCAGGKGYGGCDVC